MIKYIRKQVKSPKDLAHVWELARQTKICCIDLETSNLDAHTSDILLIQLGLRTSEGNLAYILPARDCDKSMQDALRDILEDSSILKLGHNLGFDYKFLCLHYGINIDNIWDTRWAEACLTLGMKLKNGLKDVVFRRLGMDMDKSVRANFIGRRPDTRFTEEELNYAAEDVVLLFDIYDSQYSEAKHLNLLKVIKLENSVVPITAELEMNGVDINLEAWAQLCHQQELKTLDLLKGLQQTLGKDISLQGGLWESTVKEEIDSYVQAMNINSTQQIAKYLKGFGVDLEDTSKMTLEKNSHKHPLIKQVLDYRKAGKLLTSFIYPIPELKNPVTNRWHPEYVQLPVFEEEGTTGASTGRFACRNPNFQQMPQSNALRNCFVARPGYKLITADYASMEVRIATNISGDEALITFFNLDQKNMPYGPDGNQVDATDFHGYCASLLFSKPLELVAKRLDPDGKELDPIEPSFRKIAKSVTFALFYGATAPGIAPHLGKSIKECQELVDLYYAKFPRLMKRLDQYGAEALATGYVTDGIGRRKFFDVENLTTKSERNRVIRQAKNFPIQATNASQTKRALYDLRKAFSREDFRFYATVHDEIVAEVPEHKASEIAPEMQRIMIKAADMCLSGAIGYGSTCHVGDCWAK